MDPQNPFTTPENHDHDHEESQEVVAERLIADAGQSQAMYNYSQKVLEQKERELMESIAMNYGRIREVERELGNLQLQLKLTSGPKKHALEMLRKKIETQNEKVVYIRSKHTAAKATYERLDAELKQEEAAKDQLCGELNMLVQQAARAQLDKLEELKTTLEGLYGGYVPKPAPVPPIPQQQAAAAGPPAASAPGAGASSSGGATGSQNQQQGDAGPAPSAAATAQAAEEERRRLEQERLEQERLEQERLEQERRRREAEAAAARSRHVSLSSGNQAPGPRAAGASSGRQAGAGGTGPSTSTSPAAGAPSRAGASAGAGPGPGAARPKAPNSAAAGAQGGRFAGFDT